MSQLVRKISLISPLSFFLSPLLSFIAACSNLRSWLNGLTFALFYGFFGYAHSFIDPRPDAYRKMLSFEAFPDTTSYGDVIRQYISGDISDVIERLLYVFVRSITTDAHILLLIVGFIGGFFLYLVFRKIIEYCDADSGTEFFTIIFLMIILHSPAVIGGIRFFLAFPIFLYGTFAFLIDKRNTGIFWLIISLFAHYSFIVSAFLVLFLRFYRGNINALWWCAISLCIISIFLNATSFGQLFENLNIGEYNQKISSRAELYSSAKSVARFNESLTTHLMKIQQYITRLFVLIFLLAIKRNALENTMRSFDVNLYRITLAFLSLGYFFVGFNVVGERYLLPGIFLLLILLYRLNSYLDINVFKNMLRYSLVFFVFNIGWVLFNSYVEIDLRYFFYPLPLFMIL